MDTDGLKESDRFLIDGGDGDQSFFSTPHILRHVTNLGFPRPTIFGDGLLFTIEGGEFAGRFVVLTSRSTQSISEQINNFRTASVAVFLFAKGAPFDDDTMAEYSVGMSFLDALE